MLSISQSPASGWMSLIDPDMTAMETVRSLVGRRGFWNMPAYQDAMGQLRLEELTQADVDFLTNFYATSTDLSDRNCILCALVLRGSAFDLKSFFLAAFKRERYLDMRLTALRGYAAYATEAEVEPLMAKLMQLLARIPQRAPLDSDECEHFRSPFGLPYLVEHYGYDCFKTALCQVEAQYDAIPGSAKGHFTVDEYGFAIALPKPEGYDARAALDNALAAQAKRLSHGE